MDNRKIDQDVYERYVDATVALFMEYYSAARAEDMHEKLVGNEKIKVAFPSALDERCRVLIKKEHARRQRKQRIKSLAKGFRYAASFGIILLALASVLFVSVEAIREPIINYYISLSDKYLEISHSGNVDISNANSIDWKDPLAKLVPKGYTLSMQYENQQGSVVAIYDNETSESIFFMLDPVNDIKRIDTENAQNIRSLQIAGCDGVLIAKNGEVTIAWGSEQLNKTFSITSTILSETEVINIAEEFMKIIAQ